jgi:calcium-dependent protein kinase
LQVLRSLKQFDAKLKLQQHALNLMVDILTDEEHKALARTFAVMDKNGDNLITIQEFREAMMKCKDKPEDSAIDRMFACTDLDQDGFICYHELVLASVHCKLVAREERLRNVFVKFDEDGDGRISISELGRVLGVQESVAADILHQVKSEDPEATDMDYEDFLDMWRDNVQRQLSSI